MKVSSSFTLLLCLEAANAFNINTLARGISCTNSFSYPKRWNVQRNNCLRLQISSTDNIQSYDGVDPSIGPKEENYDGNFERESDDIRPLHQNWWPVITVEALDSGRPNAVQLLGMELVLFQNDSGTSSGAEKWTCLEDRCSHRFAPLSEGRVVSSNNSDNDNTKNHIECAYHGWRFDNHGSCKRIPQLEETKDPKVKNYCKVKSFPVRIDSGMVFVWADPETANLGHLIPLPTFPFLQETLDLKGPSCCYMRDLPYGYELLGENLLDLSHLPFSHHSVGTLNRDLGGPLPFKMLSSEQKSPDMPLYEATLDEAYKTDPVFSSNPNTPKDATLNLGFYQPCHVRYTRKGAMNSYIALFFCPTSATKSRVFLFNLFGASDKASSLDDDSESKKKPSKVERIKNFVKPSSIKAKVQKKIFQTIFTPVFSHQLSHKIFDGDGIFLRMQGDRMQKEGLTYKDYKTPSAADVLVNSFRRYTKAATELTRKAGKESMAEAACSSKGYGKNLSRKDMLDRYESHTKNCKVCSAALEAKEIKKERIRLAKSIVTGGIGASGSVLGILLLLTSEMTVPTAVVRSTGKIFLTAILVSFGLSKLNEKNEEAIQQFLFEDYVHAEKN